MLEFLIMNIPGNLDKVNVNQVLWMEAKLALYFFYMFYDKPCDMWIITPHTLPSDRIKFQTQVSDKSSYFYLKNL